MREPAGNLTRIFVFRYFKRLFVGAINITFIVIALLSINEVSARMNARNIISKKILSLQENYVNQASSQKDGLNDSISIESYDKKYSKSNIDRYHTILDDLSFLELSGANSDDQNISNLREKIVSLSKRDRAQALLSQLEIEREIIVGRQEKLRKSISPGNSATGNLPTSMDDILGSRLSTIDRSIQDQITILTSDFVENSPIYNINEDIHTSNNINDSIMSIIHKIVVLIGYFPSGYANDMLIALSVILSGSIGSTLSSMRSGKEDSYYTIVTGIIAGYITFLVVKGGQVLFLS